MSNEPPRTAPPELPARLEICLSLDDAPLPGGWVLADLPMFRKNPYRLHFGPTNDAGVVVVTGEDLSESARATNDLFIMDYVGLGPDWSGEVLLKPVTLRAIDHLRAGFATWGHTDFFTDDFPQQMDSLEERLNAVAPATLIKLALLSDPGGDAEIKISSLPVADPPEQHHVMDLSASPGDPHGYESLRASIRSFVLQLEELGFHASGTKLRDTQKYVGMTTEWMGETALALNEILRSAQLPDRLRNEIEETVEAIRLGFRRSGDKPNF